MKRMAYRIVISLGALECGADEIALHHTLANRRTAEAARRAGMSALVWTVDQTSWMQRALSLGLRALITNHPARMRAAMDDSSAHV
jgi:glycerophosphoryl diester phosphodiesterase